MRCQRCGAIVPEGTPTCPHCHADLGVTQRIPVADAHWCPHCGALVEKSMSVCPKCGVPLPRHAKRGVSATPIRPVRDIRLPEIGEESASRQRRSAATLNSDVSSDEQTTALSGAVAQSAQDAHSAGTDTIDSDSTAVFTLDERRPAPRFESAIPSEPVHDEETSRAEGMPRMRVVVVTALLALVFMGGLVLYITHPWNPTANDERATQGIDLSKQGFPGTVEKLKGQDEDESNTPSTNGDPSFQAMEADYEKLADLEKRLNDNETSFDTIAISGSREEREAAAEDAKQIALEISNVVSDLSNLDDADGAYRTQLDNLSTLGNWLRNRSDALSEGWSRSLDSKNPSAEKEHILDPVDSMRDSLGKSEYQQLFEKNYDAWKPTKKQ